MKHAVVTAALAALVALQATSAAQVFAQTASGQQDVLRRQLEARFELIPLQNSTVLRPKTGDRRIRSIEVTDEAIVVDGAPVTGAELRSKLGADADLVLRLSYLDSESRRQLLGSVSTSNPERTADPPAERPDGRIDEQPRRSEESRGFGRRSRSSDESGDRVRFAGSVTVEDGEVVNGDVVAIGGSARVNGEVTGDAVAIGGGLELGPHANVLGDAVSVGGALRRAPGARVAGKVVDVGGRLPFRVGEWPWGRFSRGSLPPIGPTLFGAATGVIALLGTLMRIAVLCLLSSIVLFVGRDHVQRVGARAAAEPLKAGVIGLAAQLLFGPLLVLTIVVFVITIVGIPLLLLVPFAMLAFAIVMLIGFTAVAYNVGRVASDRFSWHHHNQYLTAITGIMLLVSPVILARVIGLADWLMFPITGSLVFLGLLAEYLAWTVGFGAVALQRFERSPTVPPAAIT